MLKSTLIKLAVAAAMAAPAIPSLAAPLHKKLATRTHHAMISSAKLTHRYHHLTHRTAKLASAKKTATVHKLSSASHRTIKTATTSSLHRTIHLTGKMPPTIDGIHV